MAKPGRGLRAKYKIRICSTRFISLLITAFLREPILALRPAHRLKLILPAGFIARHTKSNLFLLLPISQ